MELHAHIGMLKDTFEHHRMSLILIIFNPRYIWLMMLSRKNIHNMVGIRLITRSHIRNSRDIWIRHIPQKSMILRNKYCLKWRKWRQMQPKVYILKYPLTIKCIIFKYLGWISWLIKISDRGLYKLTRIHV